MLGVVVDKVLELSLLGDGLLSDQSVVLNQLDLGQLLIRRQPGQLVLSLRRG